MNERSLQNLKPFTSENQPVTKSRKGVPNRATVIKKWGKVRVKVENPTDPKGEQLEVTLYDRATIGQFVSAASGNTAAYKELQDSIYGKQADKTELSATVEVSTRVIEPGE